MARKKKGGRVAVRKVRVSEEERSRRLTERLKRDARRDLASLAERDQAVVADKFQDDGNIVGGTDDGTEECTESGKDGGFSQDDGQDGTDTVGTLRKRRGLRR